jgi:HD-GYP domain-containing protein (c-di-GMP phosphodiesterase class II)
MSDTQVLLGKIAALRQRLEQAQGLAHEAGSAAASLAEETRGETGRIWRLERHLASAANDGGLLDNSIRQLADATANESALPLPHLLTSRARRVLERARELLRELRALADQVELTETRGADAGDPLALFYRETSCMTETVLRMIQAFPDAASSQLHLCEGVEAILGVVSHRLESLMAAVQDRRRQRDAIETLAGLLSRLSEGKAAEVKPFVALADAVLAEVDQGAPLRFLHCSPRDPARFTAAHGLTVAQVIARIVRHDPELRGRPMEPVLAALVHDVGMLQVPVEVLTHPGTLNDEERRTVEQHTRAGAEMVGRLLTNGAWLAQATASHHERLDGTGYPDGLREAQIPMLTRLLSVCDVYAALCGQRPHRPARETRTALADTLLLADQGTLDPQQAERLLLLSFYPVGSVVELADGAVGVVVATHMTRRDLNTPARPVLALLTDGRGQLLPGPRHLDLACCEGRSIVRTLSATEWRDKLGSRYPELA